MAGQLIPPPELAPPPAGNTSPEQRLRMWLGMLASGEKLLLAGLRSRFGEGEKLESECRRLYQLRRDGQIAKRIQRNRELESRSTSDAS